MKLPAILFSVTLAGVLFSGCRTTAGTTATLNHETGNSLICEGNTRLRNSVAVTAITYDKVPNGLNRVNVQLTSLIQRSQHLQYRIAWYNAEGMEIDADTRTYRPLVLQGLDSVTVTGVANNPAAVTSRIRVRETFAAR